MNRGAERTAGFSTQKITVDRLGCTRCRQQALPRQQLPMAQLDQLDRIDRLGQIGCSHMHLRWLLHRGHDQEGRWPLRQHLDEQYARATGPITSAGPGTSDG